MKKYGRLYIMVLGGNLRGKGAEAMLFTVRSAIKRVAPDSVCCVISSSEHERMRLSENGFLPIERQNLSLFKRINLLISAPLSRLFSQKIMRPDTNIKIGTNMFSISSAVVDISGFASSDQFGWRPAMSRLIQICTAKLSGNKVYFMPQSWGPFNDFRTRLLTRFMLINSDLVCAREKKSHAYLLSAHCIKPKKLLLSPDIAFQFQSSKSDTAKLLMSKAGVMSGQSVIAITPNMRIYERTHGRGHDNIYVKDLLTIIKYFLDNTSCHILLIPHEVTLNKANDFELCEMIINLTNNKKDRLHMLDGNEPAADTKAVIGACDFLVASRYHSLIAALSMRIPTVVIGWSHKYDDVMNELGLKEWVIDPVRFPDTATTNVIIDAWNNRENIRRVISENVHVLEEQSSIALQQLADKISDMK